MKRKFTLIFILLITSSIKAQNLFPKKLENCKSDKFCLDCGDIKANVDQIKLEKLVENLNSSNKLNGIKGKVMFQILVDSTAKGCVLSHSDVSDNIISRNIVEALNRFDGFIPAKNKEKNEERTSFNMSFEIKDGSIKAKVERVNMDNFKKSFDKPNSPEIYNKDYVYKNEHLKDYKITVWNSQNSNLPNNMNDHIVIDKKGIIWLTVDEGLVTFDGEKFKNAEQNITEKGKYFAYYAITSDNKNTKWVYGKKNIYSYDDKKWTIYDPKEIGIDGAYEIFNNIKTGEVFFCSDEGLTIYNDGKWSNINKEIIKELPSNRVRFAKRDSKNRLWIGTYSGSIMIDKNNKVTNFEKTQTVLNGMCITSMDEDEKGNLYFGLFEYDLKKNPGKMNKNEGIGIMYTNGTWKQLTTSNSGMPYNETNQVLYDKKEKVLWISSDRAGLVRYDLKDTWENYHNENSEIPTSYISAMTFDNNGNLYLATRQGLVKVEKK
ncbi:ligand-binding sensor domain-containing protein [Flavobacterium petrolei]|uniref:ligand-binding sensor domain-containing protein n=1 Tax=Flavobacterium petrolei TaxID=2259594 RepID=UPI003756C71C|nr:two-component regulator propeller domain-containing protein [Flavobacterium sp.]